MVSYGVVATIKIKPSSAIELMLSVFSQNEFSATATFFVDRFYESALLRVPEPVEHLNEMNFMFGGPVRAKLSLPSRAAVVGGAPYVVALLALHCNSTHNIRN